MGRLYSDGYLLPVRTWHRMGVEKVYERCEIFPGSRTVDARLGGRPCLYIDQSWRPGSDGNDGLGDEVRHVDHTFLLGRRHPGHGIPGYVHDAFLLRFQGQIGAGVSKTEI